MTQRLAAFVTVGGLGFLVQLTTLGWLTSWADWPPVPATAAAVEVAILHNFWWHERWTWNDRRTHTPALVLRLVRYHTATGVTAIGNLLVTTMLVQAGTGLMAANALAVAAMSAANFVLSDRWAFGPVRAVLRAPQSASPSRPPLPDLP